MSETERFFTYDQVSVDTSKIEEYEHDLHGPITIFKDVVIAREIIHSYQDGAAYKPAKELEDAFWTADGMWAIAVGHPDTAVIMDRDQMHGRTVNPRYSKSLKDPKTKRPNNKGIVVDLEVFNNKVAPEVLTDMKGGKRHDVSIGFFFSKDETPGVIEDAGHPLNGLAYDYVQRKMAINHTAFALEAGRCPMPFCGIGADEIKMQITGDPFGEYKNFAECVKKNKDKDDPKAYCGAIKAKAEKKKDVFKTVLENLRAELDTILSNFDEVEELKRDEEETIVEKPMSIDDPPKEMLDYFTLSLKSWDNIVESERIGLVRLWQFYKEYSKVMADSEEATDAEEESEDLDDCIDCEDDEEQPSDDTPKEDEASEEPPEEDKPPVVVKKPFVATKPTSELVERAAREERY